ncbi:MAG TPA: hypothetical protein VLG92_01640 [Candidatus Saccharimonadia bacterium]|nr:hypothetical protein [Candidatus Saccharimonadia bacterium]
MALIRPRKTLEDFVNLTQSQVRAAADVRRDGLALYPIHPERRAWLGSLMREVVFGLACKELQVAFQELPEPTIIAPYEYFAHEGSRQVGATLYGERVNAGPSLTTVVSLAGGAIKGLDLELSVPSEQYVGLIDCRPADRLPVHLTTDTMIDTATLPVKDYRAYTVGVSLVQVCVEELTTLIDQPA